MRLRASASGSLRFGRAPRPGSLVFVGFGLLAVAVTAVVVGERTTAAGLAGLLSLFALGIAVVIGALRYFPSVRLDAATVRVGSRSFKLGSSPTLVLSGRLGDVERLRPAYSVVLKTADASVKLLEDSDPATVLMDLRRVLGQRPMTIEAGWGLEVEDVVAAGQPRKRAAVAGRPLTFVGGAGPGYREAGLTVIVTGILIALFLARLVIGRLIAGTPATALGLWAPTLLLLAVVLTGLLAFTARTTLSVGSEVVWSQSVLGITFARFVAPVDAVVGIHAVGPSPDRVLHVLVDLGDRVLSLPCPDADAAARAQSLRAALTSGGRPAEPAR